MEGQKLTPKQQLFIEEYLKDLNGTQAALRAGYSAKTAKEMAHENLSKPHLREAIDEALKKRSEKCEIDAEKVFNDIQDIFLAAKKEGAFMAALRAKELQGKHLGMFEGEGGKKKEKKDYAANASELSKEQLLDEIRGLID